MMLRDVVVLLVSVVVVFSSAGSAAEQAMEMVTIPKTQYCASCKAMVELMARELTALKLKDEAPPSSRSIAICKLVDANKEMFDPLVPYACSKLMVEHGDQFFQAFENFTTEDYRLKNMVYEKSKYVRFVV